MKANILFSMWIPFFGTCLGSAMVFFLKNQISEKLQKVLAGFAAGVMMAASFWSLLLPSLEASENMGKWSFFPAAIGFICGIGFLLLLDVVTPHIHFDKQQEGPSRGLKRTTEMMLAVTLHNIPEGMAVGVVCAGWLSGNSNISSTAALALAIGIAIQNFPEGAIVSMPLRAEGMKKGKTFIMGALSGIVEPIATALTILAASVVVTILPYLQAFAAGAMIYVVTEELIPQATGGKHTNLGTLSFSLGFVVMMILDVALG